MAKAKAAEAKKLKITLVKSPIGCLKDQQATVVALGLHKLNSSVTQRLHTRQDLQGQTPDHGGRSLKQEDVHHETP